MNLQPTTLPDRFYIDLAIGAAPFDDICRTYGLDPEDVGALDADAQFTMRLLQAKQSVEDDGSAFKARCRSMVHETIQHVGRIVSDVEAPARDRIEAFKTLAKLGALEPKEDQTRTTGPALSLTIIAPGGEAHTVGQVIEHAPQQTIDISELGWVEA